MIGACPPCILYHPNSKRILNHLCSTTVHAEIDSPPHVVKLLFWVVMEILNIQRTKGPGVLGNIGKYIYVIDTFWYVQ